MAPAETTVTVTSFNIDHGRGNDGAWVDNLCRRGDLWQWQCHQDERRQHKRRQASDA